MASRKTRNKNRRRQTQPRPGPVSPQRPKPSTRQRPAAHSKPAAGRLNPDVLPAGEGAAAGPPGAGGGGNGRWFTLPRPLASAALCLLVAVSYFPATLAGFVWDDVVLTMAGAIHRWSGLLDLWFAPRTLTDFEGHYWPLLYTTFWLEHKLWGLAPLGYHLVNLLLHAAVTLLLWRLLLRLEVPGAWFAAALFAVHPLHVESVVWVIGRKDVLATLFYLAAVFAYLRFVEEQRRGQYILALTLFVLGLLCKSILVTLPVALLIWHWWKQGRVTLADVRRVLPFLLLGLGIALADLSFYKGRDPTAFDASLLERALLAAHALGFYAGKLLWPTELAVIYPRWEVGIGDYLAWGCALGGVALLALLWSARHRIGRGPLAGVLFFVVTLAPTLGFVDYGYMLYSFVADRYQYLAGIGVIAILTAAGTWACRWNFGLLPDARGARIIALLWPAAAGALLVVLGTITWQQAGIYRDNFTFYSHITALNPVARFAHHSLAQAYHDRARYEDALTAYRTDNRLAREQPAPLPRISSNHIGIGRTLVALGRSEQAEEHYRQAFQLTPRFPRALENLGGFLIDQQRHRESLRHFQTLTEIAPQQARYHVGRGVSLVGLGRHDEALRSYDRALTLNPNLAMARTNREKLLEFLNNKRETK